MNRTGERKIGAAEKNGIFRVVGSMTLKIANNLCKTSLKVS
jgi:hypothetical protein